MSTGILSQDPPGVDGGAEARGGRRRGRREGTGRLEQPPFRRIFNPFPPVRGVSDDELEAIHLASLQVLERSEEHTSELQSLMRISYAVFCLKKKQKNSARHMHI